MKNFAFLNKFKNGLKDFFCKGKKKNILLVLGVVLAIIMLVISYLIPKKSAETKKESSSVSITDYSSSVESKLENMLLKIDEINSVSVMVMVYSTPKIEYLTETEGESKTTEKESSITNSTTVVFEKDGSVSTPVVVTTIMPKVTGVLVVLNKISASTKISIINSISIVLNIDSTCISILQES